MAFWEESPKNTKIVLDSIHIKQSRNIDSDFALISNDV